MARTKKTVSETKTTIQGIGMDEKSHALCSPSAAHRWSLCLASVAMEKDLPHVESEAANDGTLIHALAADMLNNKSFVCTNADFIEAATYYVDFCKSLDLEKYFVELELSLPYDKENKGTADFIGVKEDTLYVVDLKTGRTQVDAYRNPQLAIYAKSALLTKIFASSNITKVTLCIVMPRLDGIYQWTTTVSEINALVAHLSQAAKDAMEMVKGNIPLDFKPSCHACRYCKAKGTCKAHAACASVTTETASLSDEELIAAYAKVADLKAWIEAIEEKAMEACKEGRLTGYHIGEGRKGTRKWTDELVAETALVDALGDKAFVKSVITPTAAEKIMKKTMPEAWSSMQDNITQAAGKPTIFKD